MRPTCALLPVLALALAGAARGGDAVSVQLVSIGPGGERASRDVTTVSPSADGHLVAFTGGDFARDGVGRWFVRNTVAGTTEAHDAQLAELALISDDGRFVAVGTPAPSLEVIDRQGAVTVLSAPGEELRALSRNGRWAVGWFQDATSGVLVVHDLATNAARRLDLTHTGGSGTDTFRDIYRSEDAAVSDDGRWLAYQSTYFASDVGPAHTRDDGVYLYDLDTRQATRIQDHDIPVFSDSGTGGVFSRSISISSDGADVAYVALESATTVIRVYDRNAGYSYRISSAGAAAPDGDSRWPSLSADGRYVAFASAGSNLVDGDTNTHYDIFRFDRSAQRVMRVSLGIGGVQGDGDSIRPAIGADGSTIAFISGAATLVDGDLDGTTDAFLAIVLDATVAVPSPAAGATPPAGGGTPPADNGVPGASTGGTSVAVAAHCGFASEGALAVLLAAVAARRRRRVIA